MKRNYLYLTITLVSLALFGVALGLFAVPFVSVVDGIVGKIGTTYSGYDIAFVNYDRFDGRNVGVLIAWIAILLGAVSALAFTCLRVLELFKVVKINRKKKSSNIKLLSYFVVYVGICGLLPAILCFLTKQTAGLSNSIAGNYSLGVGAIITAICAFLGGSALFISETALLG